ncbi:DUF4573 domain-containing protein [candidate division KSB1 bacterium]|nr:DUF4573 domain-containing protein [candidate division KSB1 bacterium]
MPARGSDDVATARSSADAARQDGASTQPGARVDESRARPAADKRIPVTAAAFSAGEPVATATAIEPVAAARLIEPVAAARLIEPVATATAIEPVAATRLIEPVAATRLIEPVAATRLIEPVATARLIEPVATATAIESITATATNARPFQRQWQQQPAMKARKLLRSAASERSSIFSG